MTDYYNTQYYNVIERHTFYLVVQECKNIEELTDSFITKEEYDNNYPSYGNDSHGEYSHLLYFSDRIQAALIEWSETIKPGSACTSVQPAIIKELYFELEHGYIIDKFHPTGYSIQGNRIYNNEAERERIDKLGIAKAKKRNEAFNLEAAKPYERKEQLTYKDQWHLHEAFRAILRNKYNANIRFYNNNNATPFIKRNTNWIEIRKQLKRTLPKKQYPQDIIWIKKLWDNPELPTPQY